MADQEAKAHPAGDTYFADLDLIKCVEMEKQNQGIDYLDDYIDIDYGFFYYNCSIPEFFYRSR